MKGFLVNEKEVKEMEYIIKREMDEILFDLTDDRIDRAIKKNMEERYKVLFALFKRIAPPCDCFRYMRKEKRGG